MFDRIKDLVDEPADLLALTCVPPLIRQVQVTCRDAGHCEVTLDEPQPCLKPGLQVVLDCGVDRDLRIVGTVASAAGNRVELEVDRVVRRDKRAFPRMVGGIRVRYRVLIPGLHAVEEGRHGAEADGEPTWHEPDPFMDFSASGLRFEGQAHCRAGDVLLMQIRVPPHKEVWEATARVVRLEPIPPEELELDQEEGEEAPASHWIAVQFLDIPKDAVEALMDFTLKLQDALI